MKTLGLLQNFFSAELAEKAALRLAQLPPEEFAAVLPLSNLSNADRQEFSVHYLSENWTQLKSLLADPHRFFEERRAMWDKTGTTVNWDLEKDVTCIIAPAASNGASVRSQLLKSTVGKRNLKVLAEELSMELDALKSMADSALTSEEITKDSTSTGVFMAEFAVGTRILYIWYWSPDEMVTKDAFGGSVTEGIISFITDEPRVGTLHFDINGPEASDGQPGKPNDEQRADFVVRCLENRAFLHDMMEGKTRISKAAFEAEFGGLDRNLVSFEGKFGDPDGFNGPRIIIDRIPQRVESPLPEADPKTEVLSGPPQCFTCCNVVVMEDGTQVVMCDILLKEYCPPRP